MDLITDSYSGEFIAVLIAIASGSFFWLRKSINQFMDDFKDMKDHLNEIDKRLLVNETKDEELKGRVNTLVEDKLRQYYEDRKDS